MKKTRGTSRRKAKQAGDLAVRPDRESKAKGGIIIVNSRSSSNNLTNAQTTKGIGWGGPVAVDPSNPH